MGSALWLGMLAACLRCAGAVPLALHPQNPHYFLFRGQPTVLITSGEHYGAVLNLDFNYVKYLDTLKADGLNLTRTFTGAYVEPAGAFNITSNTLAPLPHRFICPWARSGVAGYAQGGNKFDLTQWDPAYFSRLKDFVAQAARRGIVVELNLFCPFYEEGQWALSPQNAANNINGVGAVARTNVYTLERHGGLLAVQEALVRKVVTELKDFDNVYYEICNEPYFGGVTLAWQHHVADVISAAEKDFRHRHLISQNVANGRARVENPHPAVSIFNFHYATPPDTVALNYRLGRVIGDNETGFSGTNDAPYRLEAWEFILAGGGLFNHLDYSFVAGEEDGTFVYPASQPGGGNPGLRRQFSYLKKFIEGFNFINLKPDSSVLGGGVPPGWRARVLAEGGRAYAVYLCRGTRRVEQYSVRWLGQVQPAESGTYSFHTFSNDGVRLWVDKQLLVDNWTNHSGREDTGSISLQKGRKYDLKLEYYQDSGNAVMRLFWSSPSLPKQIVPKQRLLTPDGRTNGLQAVYCTGKNFDQAAFSQVDEAVDFDWSDSSPFSPKSGGAGAGQTISLQLHLLPGTYTAEWFSPISGKVEKQERLSLTAGVATVTSPNCVADIALRLLKAGASPKPPRKPVRPERP